MSSKITKVAIIGTGVIGTGWIIRLLWHNKKIFIFDRDRKQKLKVIKEIKTFKPFAKRNLFCKTNI